MLHQLIECLNKEDQILSLLLPACEDQLEALKTNNHEAVETAVGKVSHLLNGISTIEEERILHKESLDDALGLERDSSLGDLVELLDERYVDQIRLLHESMSSKAERIREVNELNDIMTRIAINFNETMINALHPKENLTYGAAGLNNVSGGKLSLVNKTV
jgi:flagellar biosynthesis/type III secretory pathway chaperone